MEKVRVNLRRKVDDSYQISIGKDIFHILSTTLSAYSKVGIITDSNVKQKYGNALLLALKEKGIDALLVSFNAGEENKTRETKEKIEDLLIAKGFKRDSLLIALGGGVVGDVTGFVASTYMRGIPYIQIPTTLLAMVDSSIGGKTGVDTKSGKNLIGTFHQPKEVFIDTDFLKTLPKKEILNGISEMIKHGIILDPYYFKFLDENLEKIIALDETVVKAVKWSCQIKRSVVEKDEKESSLRKILNFGHTIGHAIEKSSTFSVTHGEAVAIGMVAEAKIAVELNLLSRENFDQIANLIKKAGFVISVERLDIDKVIDATRFDKKNSEGKVKYALPDKIGKMKIDVDVPDEIVKKVLGELK